MGLGLGFGVQAKLGLGLMPSWAGAGDVQVDRELGLKGRRCSERSHVSMPVDWAGA